MLVIIFILAALLNISVKCNIQKIIEADIIQEFSPNDFNITKMFSTMSPYHMQEKCKVVKSWIVVRHGAKWPAEDILSQINNELVPHVQQRIKYVYEIAGNSNELNYSDLLTKNQRIIIRSIIKWKNILNEGTHKELNDRGRQTMIDYGRRLKQTLKPLADVLTKDNMEVFSAYEWRCVLSAKKFLKEFFPGDYDDIDIKSSKTDERLEIIKPSEDDVKIANPENPNEKLFVETLFYKQNCGGIRDKIRKFLFPDSITDFDKHRKLITDDIVMVIYYACVYSYSYMDDDGNQLDAWCWLFSYSDLKMFEDMHDLQYYYKNGYYLNNNEKMGNPLVNDLLNFLTSSSEITFKLFVGHTSNCLSFITRFGLFRDAQPLTVESIKHMTDRKWKTSYIAPFACNIMVVIYDCHYTKFRVSIYLNEKPITMVLPNGDKCVKCLLDDVVNLIISFKTEERLTPATSKEQHEEKARKKEEKARKKKQQKDEEVHKKNIEILKRRLENVLDENEEYWDTNEKSTEKTSSSGSTSKVRY